jgi:hypothetical protein
MTSGLNIALDNGPDRTLPLTLVLTLLSLLLSAQLSRQPWPPFIPPWQEAGSDTLCNHVQEAARSRSNFPADVGGRLKPEEGEYQGDRASGITLQRTDVW